MLQLEHITVDFSGKVVLNDINETFHAGEMIGLVAPNGTGKSTLMNVIMNYVRPNKGQVIYNDVLQYTTKKNEVKIHQAISMMPDQSDLYNHLSGRAHMKMYALMWGSSPQLIDETIAALNMSSYVDKKTGTYSLGMRQRLCFAMQIVSDTKIMLMDEVMNGLDPNHVEMISKILVQKKQEGKIIIIASHLLENLEKYADRIFLMRDGLMMNVNDISPGFQNAQMTSVRVRNMSIEQVSNFNETFPETPIKTLYGGMTLIDVPTASNEELSNILTFLKSSGLQEFTFGKVTLNDLYSMYYHEL
jgi:ABC-2 type transport system ATP-binding protein